MKLLSISFKNIHSLKGRQKVRFDKEPLLSAGIFAITGATGAGKSSLLDVITLALFNQVPRFKSKISKSEIQKMGSVVTHYTDEAWAEVRYQVRQRSYLSRWEISKTRSGQFRDYDMSITDLTTNRELSSKKSDVPVINASLIGLNYDQFIRSIVLSQGEFAKFLKSKKGERSKLLEDITGTHIYRDIGAKAYEFLKEKKQATELVSARLDTISFLSSDEKSELHQSVSKKQEELKQLLMAAERATKHKEIKQVALDYESKKDAIQKEEREYQSFITHHAEEEGRLKIHQSLVPLAADMKALHDAEHVYKHEVEDIESYHSKLVKFTNETNAAITEMSSLVGKELAADSFTKEMEAFERLIDKYDNQLEQIVAKGKDLRKRIAEELPHLQTALQDKLTDKVSPSEAIQLIDTRMEDIGGASEVSTPELIVQKNELQLQIDKTHSWIKILEQEIKLRESSETIQSEIADLQKSATIIERQIEKHDAKLVENKQEIDTREKENKRAIAHASLEEHRAQLVDQEPCPLCGSLDHPLALHQAYQDVGQLSVALTALKVARQEIEATLESAKLDQASTEAKVKALQRQVQAHQEELSSVSLDKSERSKQYPELKNIRYEDGANSVETLENMMQQVDQNLHHQREINSIKSIRNDYDLLAKIIDDYQAIKKIRNKAYQGKDIHRDANQIQDKYTTAMAAHKEQAALLKKSKAQKSILSEQIARLTASLTNSAKKIGFSDIKLAQKALLSPQDSERIAATVDRLRAMATTISTKKEALAMLKSKLANDEIPETGLDEINNQLVALNNHIQLANKDIGSLQEQIKQDNAKLKQHKLLKEKLDELIVNNRKYELLNQYIGDAKGTKFSNYAQELTLSRLLSIANARLKTMNDRYMLKHDLDDDDLLVIDQYQGNAERVVRTLSGGETFIISLALALSLSDLASKNVSLESLFIDEGFGTLDPETLDMALSTLEKLQNDSGKTIGVISHVEAIKERMLTQIKVNKNAQGYGEIKIIG